MLALVAAAALGGSMMQAHAPRNAAIVETSATVPRLGLGAAYERGFLRHLSVSGSVEHVFSPRGYTHLPGFSERLGFGLWLREPLRGPFLQVTFGLAQNFLHHHPQHARIAADLGAHAGYRLAIGRHWLVGVSLGARYGIPLADRGTICTRDFQCPSTSGGFAPRVAFHVGWRWGSA